ncbi:probable ATP-dependent DNA helicase HFM1 [Boleophthalmus pectinirostris]|uniref:probable ATP-dependent DNA helicase HFM1 n=1 Tax=Boleophthalmus pectinirostris TaxID=150288 RepID=UPI00242E5536|nr:probable ATP-dependent DNA helicase HFM1 [Boleophthalmus pectinirostris]
MLDSDGSTSYLDSLFFEKPIVHEVRPLRQETSQWQVEIPPSLSQIPGTQDMQKEAFSFLHCFSQAPQQKKFAPRFKKSSDLNILPSVSKLSYNLNTDDHETEVGQSSVTQGCNSPADLWGGKGFREFFEAGSTRAKTPQASGHIIDDGKILSLDDSESPFLRRSLFKSQMLGNGGDLSNTCSVSQTAFRPQSFPGQVAMATAPPVPPPPLQPLRTTMRQAVRPMPPTDSPLQPAPEIGDTKRVLVPPMTPQPLCIQGGSAAGVLRSVAEVPSKFRSVFDFPFFNYVQSSALDDVFYTGRNFVASAPTGSGKTVLFELAIIRQLMETSEPWADFKAVYMAPIKALCSQCFENWKRKFGPLGLKCKELTGDTQIDDFFEIQDSHIILTTPEKWDSMTRKWKDNCLLELVRLFLIDEVHVVKDATRGATLEVVVSRMKTVNAYRSAQDPEGTASMRFVAVSATIPNITDIADWLCDNSGPATYLNMDESHRPVKLRKVVLGFPCNPSQTEFRFDLTLNYKMANIIQTYSDHKPTLVFCTTRKGAQQAAAVLAKDARFLLTVEHKQRLIQYANSILDSKLRDMMVLGVGYHHAGVDLSDRKLIETAFTKGDLPVLFTTRTLAMGVNLPAHLVVIKSTMQYVGGACEEYSEADLLQMIGRAGRPQFDTSATAVIMTKNQNKDKYMSLMNGMEIIESSLHSNLVEHLNAEIVLHTISDVNMALDWIRSTFLYIRALKNPRHYGFSPDLDRRGIESKLQELCLKNLNALSSIELIHMDEDINIKPTEPGRLMARYCVAFETMKQFSQILGTETLSDLTQLVSKSKEFSDIQLRMNEKRLLNTLNRDKNRTTIRFPMEGKIRTNDMKVNCLIQAQFGSITIQEFGLTQDTAKIFRTGLRIGRCLCEYLSLKLKTGFSAVHGALILSKCLRAKLWENSPFVSKQLEKIGPSLSAAMVNAGLTTFSKIEDTNAREIELILNRHPPFGNQIREAVIHLPKYELAIEQLPRYSPTTAEIVVKVNLKNLSQLQTKRTASDQHYMSLIIGDADNNVVYLQKVTDLVLLKGGLWSKRIELSRASKGSEISVHLISCDYVGLDVQHKFSVFYSGAASESVSKPRHTQNTPQTTVRREHREYGTVPQDLGIMRECNHFCKNKDLCAHDCCKIGVTIPKRRAAKPEFSSYLNDLKTRCDTMIQTPAKRLKMKMETEEPAYSRMQEYAYQPKDKMQIVPRYQGSSDEVPSRPYIETVDLTQEQDSHNFYDDHEEVEVFDQKPPIYETYQKGVAMDQSYIPTPSTRWPAADPIQDLHYQQSSQIPNINFDLGNQWDEFDEENLINTSETLGSAPFLQYNKTGFVAPSVPCVTSFATPVRSSVCKIKTDLPSPRLSPSASRLTLNLSKKIFGQTPGIFGDEVTVKTPEITQRQIPLTNSFGFFSKVNNTPVYDQSTEINSVVIKEEDAFLGIFDGIF